LKKEIKNLKIKKIQSGTRVYDWKVPPEWNIKDAYVQDKHGKKIIDIKNNNLHLISYSQPIKKFLTRDEFFKRLYFLKNQKNAIPYITSYYNKYWGFCISYSDFIYLKKKYKKKDKFFVKINSSFKKKGNLTYGELFIKGKSKKEILISTNICHPSMANNELSGPLVATALIKHFSKYKKLSKSIRFLFIPETIGSISYIKKNFKNLRKNVIGGYTLSCIGDE
jgi:aminopeptidase-like protein